MAGDDFDEEIAKLEKESKKSMETALLGFAVAFLFAVFVSETTGAWQSLWILCLIGAVAYMCVYIGFWMSARNSIRTSWQAIENTRKYRAETEELKRETAEKLTKARAEDHERLVNRLASEITPLFNWMEKDWPKFREGNSPLQEYIESDIRLRFSEPADRYRTLEELRSNFDTYRMYMVEYEPRVGLSKEEVRALSTEHAMPLGGRRIERFLEQMKLEEKAGKKASPKERIEEETIEELVESSRVFDKVPEEIRGDRDKLDYLMKLVKDRKEAKR